MPFKSKRYPFFIGITTLVVIIVFTLTGLFLWISHRESKAVAIQMADRLFTEINQKTLERYIDAELFDLFLTSGVYQTYAEKFLDPAQIDTVDVHQYLAKPEAFL